MSLPFSSRRKVCEARLIKEGFKPIFIDAIDLRDKSIDDLKDKFDFENFKSSHGVFPSVGEVGCALSHLRAYEKIAKKKLKDKYFFIAEDDCLPLVNAKEILEIINSLKGLSPDVVLLGYSKVDDHIYKAIQRSNPIKKLANVSGSKRLIGRKYTETTCGAVAYLVSQRFIKKLSKMDRPRVVADDWLYYKSEMNATILHVSPLCFLEDFNSMKSNLEDFRSVKFAKKYKRIRIPRFIRPFWQHFVGLGRRLLMELT